MQRFKGIFMAKKVAGHMAFLSYVRDLDNNDGGRISELAKRLSGEVAVQTGGAFPIFQDRNDIDWGQNWEEVIDESLKSVSFLIPIIAPQFFNSPACRSELQAFLEKEKQMGRNDLILPIYYVNTDKIDDEDGRDEDDLAKIIASRQFF